MIIREEIELLEDRDTHEGKITYDKSDHRSLTRSNNGNNVVCDADLKEGCDPNNGNKEQSCEGCYLKFDIVTEMDEAKRKDDCESELA